MRNQHHFFRFSCLLPGILNETNEEKKHKKFLQHQTRFYVFIARTTQIHKIGNFFFLSFSVSLAFGREKNNNRKLIAMHYTVFSVCCCLIDFVFCNIYSWRAWSMDVAPLCSMLSHISYVYLKWFRYCFLPSSLTLSHIRDLFGVRCTDKNIMLKYWQFSPCFVSHFDSAQRFEALPFLNGS